ncbi:hypothetical protein Q3G72_034127 [Acer saccharum]|nr:hypothetical protein Q3G72_034127 [Acer saccharum]
MRFKMERSLAELLAIQKACQLCVSNDSLRRSCINFESDSLEVVGWLKNEDFGNLSRVEVIYDIRASLRMLNIPTLGFVPRASNSVADSLAKRGVALDGENVVWSVF